MNLSLKLHLVFLRLMCATLVLQAITNHASMVGVGAVVCIIGHYGSLVRASLGLGA